MGGSRCFAEGVGTFALVFAGCGAITVDGTFDGAIGHVGVSLVFGLIVMAMIYSVGNISGAHLNPAVTVGFRVAGRLESRLVLPYIASQIAGALAAAGVLWLLFPEHPDLGATLPAVEVWRAFVLEVVLTFLLMFVILNVSTGEKEKGIMAGIAVGGAVALLALTGGPATGASMNPARSLGPAVMSGRLDGLWLYLVAPVVGACLAHPLFRRVQGNDCDADESGSRSAPSSDS